jgi:formylglycine-generating enzyme required for sulfatase activity
VIARHEVTNNEWNKVIGMASELGASGYDLVAAQRPMPVQGFTGSSDISSYDEYWKLKPLANVSWYDALKWCNLKSQVNGLKPVYKNGTEIYKSGMIVPTVDISANGYRIPTESEWEWAARGALNSQNRTYSGSNSIDAVAWYQGNSGNGTQIVGIKSPNELGIYDFSGNVKEWCFDTSNATLSYAKGGSWRSNSTLTALAYRGDRVERANTSDDLGFRVLLNTGMVFVAGGKLPKGSPLAGVQVNDFQISKNEVTISQFKEVFGNATNYSFSSNNSSAFASHGNATNTPAVKLNWYDAIKWCNALSEMEGLTPVYKINNAPYRSGNSTIPLIDPKADGYRLPTEAEWEWAARGGIFSTNTTFSGNNSFSAVAWTKENSSNSTQQVGQKQANVLGIFDMSGNALEWCWDRVSASPLQMRLKGGSFIGTNATATVAYRYALPATTAMANTGLRVARRNVLDFVLFEDIQPAIIGKLYEGYTIGAIGGGAQYSWSVIGKLPPGIRMVSSSNFASLIGTPTTAGSFVFSLKLTSGAESKIIGLEFEVQAP